MELLLNFLDTVKNGMTAHIPVYSHEVYDIIPDQKQTIEAPDFLIVEGINVFQNQKNKRIYMTGYFDFSIYIDAENELIERWYLERFDSLLELAKTDKTNYYNRFVKCLITMRLNLLKWSGKRSILLTLKIYRTNS